jgi:hypothetical protein
MNLSIQEDLWWGAQLRLPSWAGYQSRYAAYGSEDKAEPSDGSVTLIFAPEGRGLEPLSEQERGLIQWFENNEPKVSQAVKEALIHWCSCSHDRTNRFDFDEAFRAIADEDDLRRNVGLYAVNIHQVSSDGVPYVGYEFGCQWDDEHGAGVLMHGTRLVEVGSADAALLLWMAKRDADLRSAG